MRKKTFLVGIKHSGVFTRTSATTALEAMTTYCHRQGFNYRVYANKLQVVENERKKENGKQV